MSNIALNAKASLFVFIGRFSERLIGLVSTLILARLLMPDDFGLVALVWLVLRFMDAMATTGAEEYVIQKETLTDDDLNTAWTINLLLKVFIVLIVMGISPFVAGYYNEPRLEIAVPVLAFVMIEAALANPFIFQLKRERKYSQLFKIDVWAKVVSAATTISLAFLLRSYWALIFGHLASTFIKFALSYTYFSYRPQFSFRKFKEQIGFSQWMFLRGIFGYLRASLDTFLVSHRFSTETLGGYHVSRYIAMMPGADGIGPAMEPLFASFSSVQEDKERLRYQVSFALLALMGLTLPIAAFMYANAQEISNILLGQKWTSFTSVFAVLSMAVITRPLHNFCVSLLLVKKQTKNVFYYDIFTLVGMAIVLLGLPIESILQFAWYKTAFDLSCVSFFLFYALRLVGVSGLLKVYGSIVITTLFVFLIGIGTSHLVGEAFNSYFRIIVEGIICLVIWLLYCQLFFRLFLKNTTMGFHITYLESKYLRGFRFFSLF